MPERVGRTECGCSFTYPESDTVITVDNLSDLQYAINDATTSTTILVAPGTYDLRTSPYAGSGIGIQVGNHEITIRSATGNRDDVVFDGGEMATGVAKAFMISDYLTGRDSLRNITLADFTIRDASNHLIAVQGEFHPRNLMIHNLHLVNAGEQLVKVNPENLSDPVPVSNGTIACCRIEYETHLDEGYYTDGIDIHAGDHWVIRNNEIRNIRAHPDAGTIGGAAILVWTNSVGTVVERNVLNDCDRGISFGDWSHDGMPYLDHSGGVIRNNVIRGYEYANPEGTLGSYEGLSLVNTAYAVVANNTIYSPGEIDRGIDIVGSATRANRIMNNTTDKEITVRGGAGTYANELVANLEHAGASNYVDVASNDLHLVPGSAAVDGGVTYDEMCADIDCEVVADGEPDIGADEVDGGPYGGAPCDGGYDGGPVDPGDLPDLFPPAASLPPYDLCECPSPPDTATRIDTVDNAYDLQVLLYDLHVADDNRPRTILLEEGDYFLGASPFGRIQVYTSNLTIRSLSGDRDGVVLYGNHDVDYGFVLDNFGARDVSDVTIADLTVRDVRRNAIYIVAWSNDQERLLFRNVRLVNAGEAFVHGLGNTGRVLTATIECSLVELDSLRETRWTSEGIEIEQGTDWAVRNTVFRNLRADTLDTGDPASGCAVHAWMSSSGTTLERNVFDRCDRAVLLGDHAGGLLSRNMIYGHEETRPDGSIGSGTSITLSNASNAVLLANTIYAPADPPLPSIALDQAGSAGNLVQNNLSDNAVAFTGGALPESNDVVTNVDGAVAADFAGAVSGDLHLAAGSAGIDAGSAWTGLAADIDCDSVTDGTPDAGADEFVVTTALPASEEGPPDRVAAGNHPNPFNPATTIVFVLPRPATVDLKIHDLRGREVCTLIAGRALVAGRHHVEWDGRDEEEHEVPSGVYFYRLRAEDAATAGRMILIR